MNLDGCALRVGLCSQTPTDLPANDNGTRPIWNNKITRKYASDAPVVITR